MSQRVKYLWQASNSISSLVFFDHLTIALFYSPSRQGQRLGPTTQKLVFQQEAVNTGLNLLFQSNTYQCFELMLAAPITNHLMLLCFSYFTLVTTLENCGSISNRVQRRVFWTDFRDDSMRGQKILRWTSGKVFFPPLFKLAAWSPPGPQPGCLCVVLLHPAGRQWKTPQGLFTLFNVFRETRKNAKGTE